MKKFNHAEYPWVSSIDYRKHPECYKVGKGEQGLLLCEPYKSEILPFWRFKTPEIAKISARKIYSLFLGYLASNDFVGADMARKYLQMGFTRARRYCNYKGGKKYALDGKELPRATGDPKKALSAKIFYNYWQRANKNSLYQNLKKNWQKK